MKASKFARSVLAAMFFAPVLVFAQTDTPRVDQRQANQERRIEQGVQSGALTPHETAKLERGQAHVQAIEDRAKADGKVTAQERAHLAHAQDKESRRIYRQKHDAQHR